MAKVHFAPSCAIKYVGSKAKVFQTSLARPKPKLVKGDIIIVDKKTAFNLVHKGFEEFVDVQSIEFTKKDAKSSNELRTLQEKLLAFENENNALFSKNVALTEELNSLKNLSE